MALVRRQRAAEKTGREADREASERRRDQPVHPAEHDPGEDEDRVPQCEVGRHERVLHGQHHGHRRGQEARDEHRRADHAICPHAEQPSGLEVERSRAHVQADLRPAEQQDEGEQASGRDRGRHDRDLSDVDPADHPRLVQRGERRRDLAERAEPEQRDALQ